MNKVEIIQQICELRRDLADLARSGEIDKRRPEFYPLLPETKEEQMRQAVKRAYGAARARVEGMLRRIAKDEPMDCDPSLIPKMLTLLERMNGALESCSADQRDGALIAYESFKRGKKPLAVHSTDATPDQPCSVPQ